MQDPLKLQRMLDIALTALDSYDNACNWFRLEGNPGERYGEVMYGFLGGRGIAEKALQEITKIRYERETPAEDLRDLYEVYIDEMRDSLEHKSYMLNNDRCFVEWVEEHYPERKDEL